MVALAAGLTVAAFAGASHVTPVLLTGASNQGKTCDDLEGSGQNWTEFKIEGEQLSSGTYSNGTLTVTLTFTSGKVFDWSSNSGVDAVIAKGGSDGSYIYRYDPPQEETSDTGLTTPGQTGLSHISFCYDVDPKGTLVVIKNVVNDNGGSAVASDWTMNVSGPTPLSFPGAGTPGTANSVDPGNYTVTESGGPSGYTLTYSGDCDANGNVSVPAFHERTCILTNDDQPATLIVRKVVVNDHGGSATADDFSFQVNGAGAQSFEADGQNNLTVNAGTYNVVEPAVAGYATSYDDCSNIQLAPGGSATCTITNDDQPATLIVRKVVVNDNGGSAGADDFSFQVNGAAAQAFEADGENQLALVAGTYSVTEPAVAGYTTSYSNCSNLVIPLGGSATCTITNNDQPATLIVQKVVVNDNGGSAAADDFSFQVNGAAAQSFEADGENSLSVDAGTYNVVEPAVAGYTTSYSNCSNLVIPNGGSATCTITNNDQSATLIVHKIVVNDNGGTKVASDFSFRVNGGAAQAFEAGGVNQLAVAPGTYSVTEPAVAGYATSYGNCSNLVIPNGGSATCTITNNDQPATLIVHKTVVNDNGGTKQAQDFSFQVNGGAAQSFEADGANILSVNAGTYNVVEQAVAGYTTSYSNCANIQLAPGGSATCAITNNDQAPKLTLVKHVVNDSGGTAQPSAWTLSAAGVTGFSGPGPSVSSGASFDAGSYNLSEAGPAGYDASAWHCTGESQVDHDTVSVGLGDDITCTITNNDQPATLIVHKIVVNDNGGTKQAQDFSFQVNGGAAQSFEAGGANTLSVNAGTYNVVEPGVAGYTTTYQGCANIVLPLGGSATCTITNNDVPRGQGSIAVSKSADPTTIKEPGGPVTFSVTITNTSVDVMVTIDNVVDDKFGDLDDSGGNGCFDVPINLAPGEKVNCTFQRTITGAGGTSHINVVTVTGHDSAGNQLTASDDARVDITPRLIDLVIVKEASSPTPLNGVVKYSLTVTNKGPDTATNVQLADPAPAGITYLTANPSQGTCNLSPSLITCSLGSIAAGQTVTIAITARATTVGSHTNTATVTGGGGRETNPADNVDSAVTVVPAPFKPPTVKPGPEPEVCLTLTVSPKMIKADGKPDKVTVKVTAGKKRVKGVKVIVSGAGVSKAAKTNGKGVAVLKINPRKPGLITVTVLETNQKLCGPKRIGVVGVFLPPLTG